MDSLLFNCARNDVFAEVMQLVIEQPNKNIAIEDVNAHRGQEQFASVLDFEPRRPLTSELEFVLNRWVPGLLDETDDSMRFINLHDPKAGNVLAWDRQSGDCDLSAIVNVLRDQVAQVHAIQLVPTQDQHVIELIVHEVDEVFANGIRGSLIPGRVGEGLFSGKDFDETAREMVEFVRLRNVPMERSGVELSQEKDALEPRVQAGGNRNIDDQI